MRSPLRRGASSLITPIFPILRHFHQASLRLSVVAVDVSLCVCCNLETFYVFFDHELYEVGEVELSFPA